ncbi:rubrerythrin [Heliorestis convoluta]|uniref:Rubrerythrin-1 n=1 Tax=Heliorestis convoluta TaxID=356322 RepID=A0A5Q2MWU8_9FIRM|nr:rubrerythrin family protein [Heliorestis convoluta]QGG46978.1 rubrerythrin-1 [Heliorestis convoluta]
MSPKKVVQNVPGLKGTETEKNLLAAFAGESQARNKYEFFAEIAEKEGYRQIGQIFRETAINERMHAKRFLQAATNLGTTEENLLMAAAGENEEWTMLYRDFEVKAREEGFEEVADLFKEIAEVEEAHEKRYRALAESVKAGKVFTRDTAVDWHCLNCGYIHNGTEAPDICPACQHPQGWYEVAPYNY